ncbi:hypothetical protein ACB279_00115 [Escherichia coli]|uniref:hypothetical protein n=1 Tax=Escherichia coli TaxID=562 RepID=UPI0005C64133|nr:hypothetical protein [Escherichia coli]
MSTITKKRAQEIFLGNGPEPTASEERELARIALASLEAEAVCVIDQSNLDYLKSGSDADVWPASRAEMGDVLLYRSATPAPVSVPAAMEMDDDFDSAFEHGKAVGWNAYRAAMLQGADGKPELTVCYGSMPETNGKTNWTAMLHRKGQHPWEGITIERSEYPDRVRYESDRMRHLIGELSEEPDILEYDSDAHSGYVKPGNSPVIPDGWKLVPIDPTKDMLRAGQSVVGFWLNTVHCYSKMLAAAPAAPQQEVKL